MSVPRWLVTPEIPRTSSPPPSEGTGRSSWPAGPEYLGDRVDHERDEPLLDVDDDPLRPPGHLRVGEAEARAEIDDRHDLAAVVGHAGHGPGRLRERDELERVRDLAHEVRSTPRSGRRRR